DFDGQSGTTDYSARVDYSYQARGNPYSTSKEWPSYWCEDDARAVVDQYPKGRPVDVYFDPADPSRSVLNRGDYPQGKYFWVEIRADLAPLERRRDRRARERPHAERRGDQLPAPVLEEVEVDLPAARRDHALDGRDLRPLLGDHAGDDVSERARLLVGELPAE